MAQQTYGEYMRSNPPIPTLTAVEWLIEQLETFVTLDEELTWDKLFEQAKQMEKEQIIEAHGDKGWAKPMIDENGVPQKDGITFGTTTGEQYYNETYGK